jgi:hypothetical protein
MANETPISESISFSRFEYNDLLFARGLFKCFLNSFTPKSIAERTIRINPDLKLKQILEILSIPKPLFCIGWNSAFQFIAPYEEGYLFLMLGNSGQLDIKFNSEDIDAIKKVDKLAALFDKFRIKNKEANGIWATFTYTGPNGIAQDFEFLKCPRWNRIQENYPGDVNEKLSELISLKKPWNSGRLIILSGPAGTGKTYFIRSLMMAWRKKFDFFIVTDPERYTADPAYYYAVGSKVQQQARRLVDEEGEPTGESSKSDHSLIILEDSADLILKESRSKHFDKLGKLLNMTDGLLGQGRENVYLITFNEDVAEIDPAFLRPGRCISNIGFTTFDSSAAIAWLKSCTRHKEDIDCKGEKTLAELYAMRYAKPSSKKEPITITPKERLGFCPS